MTADPARAESVEVPACRNCGAPAPGTYCPACGQETQARLPKFTQFMREAAGRYVALDGRLWRTLAALLFRPGFLTREYLAGRRRRYIRPAKLFLVASLLLFAVLRIVVEIQGPEVPVAASAKPEQSAKPSSAKADSSAPTEAAAKADAASKVSPISKLKEAIEAEAADERKAGKAEREKNHEDQGAGFRIDDDMNIDLGIEIPALKRRLEHFKHLSAADKGAQILDGVFRYGPYAMFVLLPAFGFLLKLLYLGRGRRYPLRPRLYSEHLVFAAHNTAFLSLGIVAATLAVFGPLRVAIILWILIYLVWSMRVVYRGPWVGIAARSMVIVVAYSVMFGFVTAGLVIAAVVLR